MKYKKTFFLKTKKLLSNKPYKESDFCQFTSNNSKAIKIISKYKYSILYLKLIRLESLII